MPKKKVPAKVGLSLGVSLKGNQTIQRPYVMDGKVYDGMEMWDVPDTREPMVNVAPPHTDTHGSYFVPEKDSLQEDLSVGETLYTRIAMQTTGYLNYEELKSGAAELGIPKAILDEGNRILHAVRYPDLAYTQDYPAAPIVPGKKTPDNDLMAKNMQQVILATMRLAGLRVAEDYRAEALNEAFKKAKNAEEKSKILELIYAARDRVSALDKESRKFISFADDNSDLPGVSSEIRKIYSNAYSITTIERQDIRDKTALDAKEYLWHLAEIKNAAASMSAIGRASKKTAPGKEEPGLSGKALEMAMLPFMNDSKDFKVPDHPLRAFPKSSSAVWGSLEHIVPSMPRSVAPILRKKRYTKSYVGVPRYHSRVFSDMRIGALKKRLKGMSILIDMSGSMAMTDESILAMLDLHPGSTIAGYSGSGSRGYLLHMAENGRMAEYEDVVHHRHRMGGGNIVDGPALYWLADQPEPRVWISDQFVTGIGDNHADNLVKECQMLSKLANIKNHTTIEAFLVAERLKVAAGK